MLDEIHFQYIQDVLSDFVIVFRENTGYLQRILNYR